MGNLVVRLTNNATSGAAGFNNLGTNAQVIVGINTVWPQYSSSGTINGYWYAPGNGAFGFGGIAATGANQVARVEVGTITADGYFSKFTGS